MTIIEANKIAVIIGEADGGCINCVTILAKEMQEAFTAFEWTVNKDAFDYTSDRDVQRVSVKERYGRANERSKEQ